ncbi:MAG TPA: hypothetical protein VKH46_05130 [Thermoanaerobaculia bacterium]|nr:hypothetical protein [Thermoanaerobaculia bacterium]
MKVLFLHFTGEARDAKAARLAKSGAELIVEEPRWPRFYELARKEKPAAIVIDFSRAPSHALETTDYLSKAKDTRDLELFAIHVFDDRKELLKERVPKAQVYSERELAAVIAERLPKWEAARAAAEEAAREERQQRLEERKVAAAASRARAREKRLAARAAAAAAEPPREGPAPAPEKAPRAAAPKAKKPEKRKAAPKKKAAAPARSRKPARSRRPPAKSKPKKKK